MNITFGFPFNKENESKRVRNKGYSIIDFPENYVVIDIETTGLDPNFDEIIEIAAIKIENMKIIETFETLVKPNDNIDSFIESLTGITNEKVKDAPSISDILPAFLEFTKGYKLVGHNVNFDINFIYDICLELYNKDFNNDYIDTMRISRKLFPNLKHHRLVDMVNELEISDYVQHRALSDIISTYNLFNKLKELAIEKYGNENKFIESFKRKISSGIDLTSIIAETTEFDKTHPLYNKLVVFTGTLEKFIRKDAMQYVVNLGGKVKDSITKETNFLVVGTQDYSKFADGNKSSKMKKAEKLILDGLDINIISESTFYDMLEDNNN